MDHQCVETGAIHDFTLNPNLAGFNNVIGFLNGIQSRFPDAISLVAGMPDENYFDVESHLSAFYEYGEWLSVKSPESKESLINKIGQYGNSRGIINEHLAKYLWIDQGIIIQPENIIVTVGAQEAFAIIVSTICHSERDVILMEDPCYIGVSSFASLFGHPVEGTVIHDDAAGLEKLAVKIGQIRNSGRSVRLLYVIPDYQNPLGTCMSLEKRQQLLKMAELYNFLIIEDAVYNRFSYDGERQPTLKSLDVNNRVIYVGSFSKLLFPGLRVGVMAVNQKIRNEAGQLISLVGEMEKVKGQITNNTSTISQSILAGILIRNHYSLERLNEQKIQSYKHKRDIMIGALDKYIGAYKEDWASGISWNRPAGGFFIRMILPFKLTNDDVMDCAERYSVVFCRMTQFYLREGGENEIRLCYSNNSTHDLDKGIAYLALFLQSKAVNQPSK